MKALDLYLAGLDRLREARRSATAGLRPCETQITGELEDIYISLTDAERDEVESQGWRAWPDLFDARST